VTAGPRRGRAAIGMERAFRTLPLLAAFFVSAAPGHAQSWAPVGPFGGDVRSLVTDPHDPRIVYLGTASGSVYRSEDSALHWRRAQPGFPLRDTSIDDLVVDPAGVVYAGYWEVHGSGGGVARSEDGGRTFTVLPGIAGQAVRALAIAPSNPRVLVAGALAGVFRSRDAGQTWERISPEGNVELRNVNSVAIDPANSETIYAGTWHLPWKTRDGGTTWRSIHAGIIDDSDIMTLTIDRRLPDVLYATACSGIYRTRDAAQRWTKIRGIPSSSRRTRAFALHPLRTDTLFAGTTEGFWTSEDGGGSWRLRTDRRLVVNAVLVLPDGTLLLGADGAGILRSSNGGVAWAPSNLGFSERFVSRVLFDPVNKRVLAGVLGDRQFGGVFAAPRPEGPWNRVASGLEGREVLSLALAGPSLLAGTDDGVFLAAPGEPWRRLPTVVDGVEAHPRVVDVVAVSDRSFLVASPKGVLRSADGGERWERKTLGVGGPVLALGGSLSDRRFVIAATPIAFYVSPDGGASWEIISEASQLSRVHALAFLPGDDRVVFAATSGGLLKSADQGRTWHPRGGGLPQLDITGLALHPDGRTLAASDYSSGGLWRSEDAGDTWTTFPTEGLVSTRVWTLALDPGVAWRPIAAPSSGGLHAWRPAPEGSPGGQ
jgi:photosystem II stability/assembly factor-like uncharacterized protein